MKKTRRFAAMVAAMAIAATLVAPSMTMMNARAEDVNINIKVLDDGSTENEVTHITPDADNATHTYMAYQIFKGAYTLKPGAEEGSQNEEDYEFKVTGLGSGAGTLLENAAFLAFRPSDADISVGEALAKLPDNATNDQKAIAAAQAISGISNGSPKADELAEILSKVVSGGARVTTEATPFAEGYYLVIDSYTAADDASSNNDKPDALSKFILRVNSAKNTNGITIIPKKSYPEVIKKVQENVKTTTDYEDPKTALQKAVDNSTRWNDVADYNIGDDVPFQLYGSMPETLADYDAYYYNFTDTLGEQFNQPKVVTVKIGEKELTYTLNEAGTAYELPAADQLKAAPATSVTTYTFKDAATQSKIYAELKNNAEYTALTAAEKAAYIYTNWTTLTDATNGALKDLGFTDKADAITVITTEIPAVNADSTTDGNCRVTWDGEKHKLYVSIEDVKAYAGVSPTTIVTVNYKAKLNEKAVIGLNGQENKVDLTYSNNPNEDYGPKNDNETDIPGDKDTTPEDKVVVFTYEVDVNKIDANTKQNLEGAEFTLSSGTAVIKFIDNGDGTYTVADQTLTEGVTTTVKSDADGLFKLVGLDDGTYVLTETKAPDGYPAPNPNTFELKLTATTVNNQTWGGSAADALKALSGTLGGKNMDALGTGTVTPKNNARGNYGGVKGQIQNSKTTTLPSTGGIGTTLFVAGGGLTAVLAGVYLVAKKRSKSEE